ncbi:MAG: hypothetical protein QX188_07915 [Methylococcaceae bacterium]
MFLMKGWSNWSPILSKRLQDEGKSASRHRVAKLMRDNDWRAKAARKYKAKKVA